MEDSDHNDGEGRERNDGDRRPWRERRRGSGHSATVAAAVLVLFGAMSRLGKTPESPTFLELDKQSERRIQLEEKRLRAIQVIGSVPAGNDAGANLSGRAEDFVGLPPLRDGLDADPLSLSAAQRRPGGASSFPEEGWDELPENETETLRRAPQEDQEDIARPRRYLVAEGDTWAKIAKRFLGDQNRWREIMDANPAAKNGLKVGMPLVLP